MAAIGPKPSTNPGALSAILNNPLDSTISRFVRVLQTQAGVDSTMFAFGYTSKALSALLEKGVEFNVKHLAEKLAENAAKQIQPGETIIATQTIPPGSSTARLADAAASLKVFSGICSEVRTVMRLWGVLKLWVLFKATYQNPSPDPIIRNTGWAKMACLLGYYTLEPYWYLSTKGVIRNVKKEDSAKAFRVSCWAYIAYMVLDYVRLYRQAQMTRVARAKAGALEKEDKIKQEKEDEAWWLSFIVNSVYFPLTIHWAQPEGFIPDGIVGAYGSLAGWAGLRAAWKATV